MSALIHHEPTLDWGAVQRTWAELDVPEGWRPEVTSEGIAVVPPPGGQHNLIGDVVNDVLTAVKPKGWGAFQTLGVGFPTESSIFIPDFAVVRRADIPVGASHVPAEKLLLAVEITSASNAASDRTRKKWCYAHGDVPLYLLIDPHAEEGPSVSLFSDPREGSYRHAVTVPFGDKITIPEPFDVEFDTSEF